jgi:hypothetical protein
MSHFIPEDARQSFLLAGLFVSILFPAGIAQRLLEIRQSRSPIILLAIAAAPLPALLALTSLWFLAKLSPVTSLRVDEAGSADWGMMYSLLGLALAVLTYVVGAIGASIFVIARRI